MSSDMDTSEVVPHNLDSNSLLDSDPVEVKDAKLHGHIIAVPYIYINVKEKNGIDRVVHNYRVVQLADLFELTQIAIEISSSDKNEQINICSDFIKRLASKSEDDIAYIMQFLQFTADMSRELDIDDDFNDTTTPCYNEVDIIRRYITDANTMLIRSYDPSPYTLPDGKVIHFFSQIPNTDPMWKEQMVETIRKENNDTDYNRVQRLMLGFEKTLTFIPGYVYSRTVQVINLALFYMCLYDVSKPIQGWGSNDLKGNMLGYIIDLVIRSRVVQAWQREEKKRYLIADMTRNYDPQNPMIKFCQIDSARERSKHFISLLMKTNELVEFAQSLDYDKYVAILQETVVTPDVKKFMIDGYDSEELNNTEERYYSLGSKFITSIALNLPNLEAIKKLYEKEHGLFAN